MELVWKVVLPKLKELAKENGITLAELSNAWLLQQEGVGCIIVGASTVEQVKRNSKIIKLSDACVEQCNAITDELKTLIGGSLDQYAKIERIHGNNI